MTSKKFQEFQSGNIQDGIPGDMVFGENGLPQMPPGWTPPNPSIPSGYEGGIVEFNGVKGLRISKAGLPSDCCMLYIHGGGYTIGTAMENVDILTMFVDKLGIECYSVEYTLATDARFPSYLDDCVNFFKGIMEQGRKSIVIGGESAGACLSITATIKLMMENYTLPAAVWASSPPAEALPLESDLYKKDQFTDMVFDIYKFCSPDTDPRSPLLSPAYADYSGFPPLLLQAGGSESLCAGAVKIATAAIKADCEVSLHVFKDMGHTVALAYGSFPEADQAIQEIIDFIKYRLDIHRGLV